MEGFYMAIKEEVFEIPEQFREPEWNTNKVKVRKWSAGIKARITDECMKMTVTPGSKEVNRVPVQGAQFQLLMVTHQIVEAPWQVGNLAVVEGLDPDLFDWLMECVTKINGSGIKNSSASA